MRARIVWFTVAGFFAALIALLYFGSVHSFEQLGVPVMLPHLADMQIVTEGARCADLGLDPLVDNPCDPWGRPMNYPRVWLSIAELFGRSPKVATSVGVSLWLLAMTLLFARHRPSPQRLAVFTLAVFNPATLLLFERGNIDVFIAALVGASALTMGRPGRGSFLAATIFVVAASVLKIYPLVLFIPLLLVAFLSESTLRRFRLAVSGLGAAAAATYFVVTFHDVLTIGDVTPKPASYGFGLYSLALAFHHQLTSGQLVGETLLSFMALALIVLIFAGRPDRLRWPDLRVGARQIVSSPDRVAVFVTATALAGVLPFANYPYRLVLLSLLVGALSGSVCRMSRPRPLLVWVVGSALLAPWLVPMTRRRTLVPLNLGSTALDVAVIISLVGAVALAAGMGDLSSRSEVTSV